MEALPALQAGEDALRRGDWQSARTALLEAAAQDESPRALEGLGTACWFLDDKAVVLDARERAFRLYREQGDARGAARVATALAIDYADYRSDFAVCSGWLQRADSLLRGVDLCAEHGWLRLYQGFAALMFFNDLEQARQSLEEAKIISPKLGVIDIEMMSIALEGLILIRENRIAEGMRRLDEAMTAAVGGEMRDLAAIGNTCCTLIYACEAVADYDRAYQWCERTREFCLRFGLGDLLFAICRNYYATVLIWKGQWDRAESELAGLLQDLQRLDRTNYVLESRAKLGELRRRQGRLREAEELFAGAEPHRLALLGRSALELDQGRPRAAIDLAERVLRRVGEEDQAERIFAIDLLVRAHVDEGELEAASRLLAELEAAAAAVATRPLLATAAAARGAVAFGRGEVDAARAALEDAIDLFETTHAEFEAARSRLELAAVLRKAGRQAAALEQAVEAQTVFKRLGAGLYAERASALAENIAGSRGRPRATPPNGLTPREAEVLWLIARGRTNQQIAEELVLSIRTVERHISTIYEKLQLHGRSARAAAAALALSLQTNT